MNKILRALAEGRLLHTIWRWIKGIPKKIDYLLGVFTRFIMRITTKVEPNKVFFHTQEILYCCNPKYISEEFLRQGFDGINIVWRGPKKGESNIPEDFKTVPINSYAYFKELFSSKVVVTNSFLFLGMPFKLRKDQILIQTWHGSLGLKKHGKEVVTDSKERVYALEYTGDRSDYCIINSTLEQSSLRETYWPHTKMMMYGHPRNDIMFPAYEAKRKRLKEELFKEWEIPADAHIIMYAPTFRNSQSFKYYKIDFDRILDAVEKRFGGEWRMFLRFHPSMRKLAKKQRFAQDNERVIDATPYPDMQELIAITDIAITDYSSWIYDFVLSRKPGFIFATDIEEYTKKDRGFYYPIETTPFAIAQDNDQLVESILNFNEADYKEKVEAFLEDKGCIEDGHAAERTVKLIRDLLQGREPKVE